MLLEIQSLLSVLAVEHETTSSPVTPSTISMPCLIFALPCGSSQVGGVFVILASVITFSITITLCRLLVRVFRAYLVFRHAPTHTIPRPLMPFPPSAATTASDFAAAMKGSMTTTTSSLSSDVTVQPPIPEQPQLDMAAALKCPSATTTTTIRQALSKALVHVFLRSCDSPTGESSPCNETYVPEVHLARPIKCNPPTHIGQKDVGGFATTGLMPSPFAQQGSPFKVPLPAALGHGGFEPSSPARGSGQPPAGSAGGVGQLQGRPLCHPLDLQSSPSLRRERYRTSGTGGASSSMNKLGLSIDRTALASAFKQVFRTQPSLSRTEDLGYGAAGINTAAGRTHSGSHAIGWNPSGAHGPHHGQGHQTLMSTGSAQYTDLLRATPEEYRCMDVSKLSPSPSQQSTSISDRTTSAC